MKSFSKIMMVIIMVLSSISAFAQIKNAKTETIKIYGNCEMCKSTIEKAGKEKKLATVKWDKNTKLAILTYDSVNTNSDDILKRIALAGYDNEKFSAPENTYANLHNCCKYDRKIKSSKNSGNGMIMESQHDMNHSGNSIAPEEKNELRSTQNVTQFDAIYEKYFLVKDALVKSDSKVTAIEATDLLKAVQSIDVKKLSTEEQSIWKKVRMDLAVYSGNIVKSNDLVKQREEFALLSEVVYRLAKASKQDVPVYYQHCPMYNKGKGANWLSKEKEINNPYYGAQMLNCGSVQETLR